MPEEDKISPEETQEPDSEGRMSFWEHLAELRSCLVRSVYVVLGLFIISFFFAEDLFNFFKAPLMRALPEGSKLIFTSPAELFFTYMKLALLAAVVVGAPFIFYQLWRFIAPGLYENERRLVWPFVSIASALFMGGAVFCFGVAFPVAFQFFMGMSTEDIVPMIKASEYLSFSISLLLAFGLVFEAPLVLVFMAKLGLITAAFMRKKRRYAILIIFIIAAMVSPTPDAINQFILAVPMMLLYEASIFLIARMEKKRAARVLAEEQA